MSSEPEVAERFLLDEDLACLAGHAEVRVDAYPGSGTSPFDHYYVVVLEDLRLEHRDLGLDAAIIGLAEHVARRVRALLQERSHERERLLPLLARLHLADLDGSLGRLLVRSTRLITDGTVLDRHEPGD